MAKLSTKRSPQVPTEDMVRVIQQIYDDINDIIRAINNQTSEDSVIGKVGDIKVLSNEYNTYELRIKTKDGWVKTNLSFVDKEI